MPMTPCLTTLPQKVSLWKRPCDSLVSRLTHRFWNATAQLIMICGCSSRTPRNHERGIRTRRFEHLFQELNRPVPEGLSEAYIDNLTAQVILNPGALEMLDALKDSFQIALITNGMSHVQRQRLAKSLIRDHITEIIVQKRSATPRPAEIFTAALALLGT